MDRDIASRQSWNAHVPLSAATRAEMAWWRERFDTFNGTRPIWRPTLIQRIIHADAAGPSIDSVGGWGAWVDVGGRRLTAQGRWTAREVAAFAGFASTSSTAMELMAGLYALQSFQQSAQLPGTTVMLVTDSRNACSVLQHGRTKMDQCVVAARDIHAYCFDHNIRLLVEWVP